jgi:heme/copper-type cytochrome/quinol oxidase subunit 2
MFRYFPGKTISATELPGMTPFPSVTGTFPATTPDLRSPDAALPRSDGTFGRTEMIVIIAVIAALVIVAVILAVVIARLRAKRKQIYPENEFDQKPRSTFVVANIHSIKTVQP